MTQMHCLVLCQGNGRKEAINNLWFYWAIPSRKTVPLSQPSKATMQTHRNQSCHMWKRIMAFLSYVQPQGREMNFLQSQGYTRCNVQPCKRIFGNVQPQFISQALCASWFWMPMVSKSQLFCSLGINLGTQLINWNQLQQSSHDNYWSQIQHWMDGDYWIVVSIHKVFMEKIIYEWSLTQVEWGIHI